MKGGTFYIVDRATMLRAAERFFRDGALEPKLFWSGGEGAWYA